MKLKFDLEIHTFDIDFNGHVSNIVFVRWLEIGRLKMLDAVGMPVSVMMEQGMAPMLVETHIKYHSELKLGDQVSGRIWLSRLAHTIAMIEFEFIKNEDEVVATASQRGLFIDTGTRRPKKLSESQRAQIEKYLIS